MTRRRTISFMLGLATTAAAGVLATTSPAAAETGNLIMNVNNNDGGVARCLQPADASLESGAAIVQEPCDDENPAQHWTADGKDGQVVRYHNVNSGLCLDAFGSAANGTHVIQWPCNSISNERWQHVVPDIIDVIDGPIISRVSGTSSHCLDVPNDATTVGLQVQIWRCNGTAAQQWNIFF
jgi:Ricin-type beta-trefoil lectin domain